MCGAIETKACIRCIYIPSFPPDVVDVFPPRQPRLRTKHLPPARTVVIDDLPLSADASILLLADGIEPVLRYTKSCWEIR